MRTTKKRKIVEQLMTISLILSCTVLGLSIATLVPKEEIAVVTKAPANLNHIDVGSSFKAIDSSRNGMATLVYSTNSEYQVVELKNEIMSNVEEQNVEESRSASMSALNAVEPVETMPILEVTTLEAFEEQNDANVEDYFGVIDYTEEDVFYMAAVIYAESRGEPYTGKVGVGATVVNRVMHPDFPDTIYGVITQECQYASIYGITEWMIDQVPECWEAAIEALNGIDPTYEMTGEHALYFYNPLGCSQYQLNARANIKNTCTIGAHIFYRNW